MKNTVKGQDFSGEDMYCFELQKSLEAALGNSSTNVVEDKNAKGSDYVLVEKTEKQLIYRDSNGCSLIHEGDSQYGKCYLLELEEKQKEPSAIFDVTVYRMYSTTFILLRTWRFEDELIDKARAEAARHFRSLRDDELDQYNFEQLEWR